MKFMILAVGLGICAFGIVFIFSSHGFGNEMIEWLESEQSAARQRNQELVRAAEKATSCAQMGSSNCDDDPELRKFKEIGARAMNEECVQANLKFFAKFKDKAYEAFSEDSSFLSNACNEAKQFYIQSISPFHKPESAAGKVALLKYKIIKIAELERLKAQIPDINMNLELQFLERFNAEEDDCAKLKVFIDELVVKKSVLALRKKVLCAIKDCRKKKEASCVEAKKVAKEGLARGDDSIAVFLLDYLANSPREEARYRSILKKRGTPTRSELQEGWESFEVTPEVALNLKLLAIGSDYNVEPKDLCSDVILLDESPAPADLDKANWRTRVNSWADRTSPEYNPNQVLKFACTTLRGESRLNVISEFELNFNNQDGKYDVCSSIESGALKKECEKFPNKTK